MNETPVVQVLEGMKKLLTPEGAWTQGTFARDEYGEDVDCFGDRAVSYCIIGAKHRVLMLSTNEADYYDVSNVLRNAVSSYAEVDDVTSFNDLPSTNHKDVLKVLDLAISIAKKRVTV